MTTQINQSTEEKVFNLLEESNLNWEVQKKKLMVAGTGIVSDSFGMVASESKKGDRYLGTVKQRYTILQNSQLAHTIVEASESILPEAEITGNSYRKGRLISMQVELPSMEIGKGGEVQRYLTGLNSHDGRFTAGFGFLNHVMICSNQFAASMRQINRFRHSASLHDNIKEAKVRMIETLQQEKMLMEMFQEMAQIEVTGKDVQSFVDHIMPLKENKEGKPSTRTENERKRVLEAVEISIDQQGSTQWGLFNGATHYTNHMMKTKNDAHLIDGTGERFNYKALAYLSPKA